MTSGITHVATKEIFAALCVTMAMLSTRNLDLFVQFERLGWRSILASRTILGAAVTAR